MNPFEKLSSKTTQFAGSTTAFLLSVFLVLALGFYSYLHNFSAESQAPLATITAAITFTMVFLIQRSQNKEMISIQIKLDELVLSNKKANNRLLDIEHLSECELIKIKEKYKNETQSNITDGSIR